MTDDTQCDQIIIQDMAVVASISDRRVQCVHCNMIVKMFERLVTSRGELYRDVTSRDTRLTRRGKTLRASTNIIYIKSDFIHITMIRFVPIVVGTH